MKSRDAYRRDLEARMAELKARLDVLRAQGKRMSAGARETARREVVEIDQALAELKERLERLRASGGEAWTDVKGGVGSAWSELNTAVRKALNRFGGGTPRGPSG